MLLLAALKLTSLALSAANAKPLFVSAYEGVSADVSATTSIAAPAEQIFTYLLDLQHVKAVIPCIGKWEMSQRTFGEGASAMVRYDVAAMHRKLPVSLSRADAPYRIDLEHLGNRGFTTVITLKAVAEVPESGTVVTILTPLNPPPWPFRKYFYDAVQSEWKKCYASTLENLSRAVGHSSTPSAPANEPG